VTDIRSTPDEQPMTRTRWVPISMLALVGALFPLAPAAASPVPVAPNFSESRGCGDGIPGPVRPRADRSGFISSGQVLAGPWAAFFGYDRAQIEASMVDWVVPGSGGVTVKVHQRALPAFQQVSAALAATGLTYRVRDMWGWTYRTVAGSKGLSVHAFGGAVDINPRANPYAADLITDMPDWYVTAWESAGFCWGGDWISKKDAMHYSWMGPTATAGHGDRPAPYPPVTGAAGFTQRALATTVPAGMEAVLGLADRSGDGSDDLYAAGASPAGDARVLIAGSRFAFTVTGIRRDVPGAAPGAEMLLGDHDGDGRADLWLVDRSGPTVAFTVVTDADEFRGDPVTVTSAVPATDDVTLAFFDGDYVPDVVAVDRTGETTVTVWSGASGYTATIASWSPGLGDTSDRGTWQWFVADRWIDGIPDLHMVRAGTPATVEISAADGRRETVTTGFGAGPETRVLPGDHDGDGRADLFVVDGRSLAVYLGGVPVVGDLTAWFRPDIPHPWDAGPECLGPGPCDQIGYAAGDRWHLRDAVASESGDVEFIYGNPGDVPMAGDWDCDGIATPGLYRPADGYVYLRNSNSQGIADREFYFGNPGDVPLAGDFNGDGCDTVSLYRPAEGRFYVIDRLGSGAAGLGRADHDFYFGNPGDKAFTGDFDGDGVDEVGLHRESTGLVYLRLSHTTGPADLRFIYGDPGDRLVAGDWDGDGVDTVAVYRPSDGNWYIKLTNAEGVADHSLHDHASGTTLPIAGVFGTDSLRAAAADPDGE
jgi:hypothetical protein